MDVADLSKTMIRLFLALFCGLISRPTKEVNPIYAEASGTVVVLCFNGN